VRARFDVALRDAATDWEDGQDCSALRAQLLKEGFATLRAITHPADVQDIRAKILSALNDGEFHAKSMRKLGDPIADLRDAKILEIVSPSAIRPRLLKSTFFNAPWRFREEFLDLQRACILIILLPSHRVTPKRPRGIRMAYHRIRAPPDGFIGGCLYKLLI
jgi:hypothetical protein